MNSRAFGLIACGVAGVGLLVMGGWRLNGGEPNPPTLAPGKPAGSQDAPHLAGTPTTNGTTRAGEQSVSTSPSRPPGAPTEELLEAILRKPSRKPAPDVLLGLSTKDTPALVTAFKKQPRLQERVGLTWALAYAGGEEAVAALEHQLMNEFAGKYFESGPSSDYDEEMELFNTVFMLGILAAESDRAFAIVKDGTNPNYWREHCKWTSDRGGDRVGILTALSIQAVGLSGRPGSRELIAEMKEHLPGTRPGEVPLSRNLSGPVVDAAFYADTIQSRGMDAFRRLLASNQLGKVRDGWEVSERGKQYDEWFLKHHRAFGQRRSGGPGK